jgi:hypothetical protein
MIPLVAVAFIMAPAVPSIDVDGPGSRVLCTADFSYCWIELGECSDNRPNSLQHLNGKCSG